MPGGEPSVLGHTAEPGDTGVKPCKSAAVALAEQTAALQIAPYPPQMLIIP